MKHNTLSILKHSKKESKDISVDFLENYIHLFLMDINRLILRVPTYCNYDDYESREPKYGKALLQAYHHAFNTPLKQGRITPSFIKMVHKHAASHMSDTMPGHYRKEPGNFLLRMVIKGQYCAPSASVQGVIEFIQRWFIQEAKPVHMLHFSPVSDNKPEYLLRYVKKNLVLWSEVDSIIDFDLKENHHRLKLEKLLHDPDYDCHVNSTPDECSILPDSGYSEDKIEEIISEKLQLICDKYNAAIYRAASSIQKKKIIITACQEIEQLHPFPDCNARVCRVLMDRFLHEIGQPLTLHMDINRLDGFSIEKLNQFITAGQKRYLALCRQQPLEINDDPYTPPEKMSPSSTVIPDAKEEINNFKKIIYNNLLRSKDFMIYHFSNLPSYPKTLFFPRDPLLTSRRLTLPLPWPGRC